MAKLHFDIHGEDFTRLARERVLDGQWEKAVLLLVDGLIGMTHDIAHQILNGDKKLVGNAENMELVDEDSETASKHKESLQFMFGNFHCEKGKWYRPYAIVTDFGICDMQFFCDSQPGSWETKDCSKRALYYANDRKRDIVKSMRGNIDDSNLMLLEPVDSPPIWMISSLSKVTLQSIYDRLQRHLERRGASKDAATLELNERKRLFVEDMVNSKTPVDSSCECFSQNNDDSEKLDEEPPAIDITLRSNLKNFECGWITPDGCFYGCSYMEHKTLAGYILEQKYGVVTINGYCVEREAE